MCSPFLASWHVELGISEKAWKVFFLTTTRSSNEFNSIQIKKRVHTHNFTPPSKSASMVPQVKLRGSDMLFTAEKRVLQ